MSISAFGIDDERISKADDRKGRTAAGGAAGAALGYGAGYGAAGRPIWGKRPPLQIAQGGSGSAKRAALRVVGHKMRLKPGIAGAAAGAAGGAAAAHRIGKADDRKGRAAAGGALGAVAGAGAVAGGARGGKRVQQAAYARQFPGYRGLPAGPGSAVAPRLTGLRAVGMRVNKPLAAGAAAGAALGAGAAGRRRSSVGKAAFGVDDYRVNKAERKEPSAGRMASGWYFSGLHGAVAGKKGKKLRAAGGEMGGVVAGSSAGSIVGRAVARRNPVMGNMVGSAAGGAVGGMGMTRRAHMRGYYKPEK